VRSGILLLLVVVNYLLESLAQHFARNEARILVEIAHNLRFRLVFVRGIPYIVEERMLETLFNTGPEVGVELQHHLKQIYPFHRNGRELVLENHWRPLLELLDVRQRQPILYKTAVCLAGSSKQVKNHL